VSVKLPSTRSDVDVSIVSVPLCALNVPLKSSLSIWTSPVKSSSSASLGGTTV
jgi:hypothetical protein